MPESLETSLDDLFTEGGLFEDETLAPQGDARKPSPPSAAADWLEPDAIALSPDDPEPTPAGASAPAGPFDPSEVALDPADAPPLELDN